MFKYTWIWPLCDYACVSCVSQFPKKPEWHWILWDWCYRCLRASMLGAGNKSICCYLASFALFLPKVYIRRLKTPGKQVLPWSLLMQRPWRGAACWLAPHDLLSLLSYRTQDHLLRSGNTHGGLDPLTSIINWENVPHTCLKANMIEAFSHMRLLFPGWC